MSAAEPVHPTPISPFSTPTRLAPIHLRTLEEEIRRAGLFDLLADESLTDLVVHEESPILEALLPLPVAGGRMRVEAILPPVSAAPILCLRRPPTRILTLEELEASGSVPVAARELLERAVLDRRTILISGGTSSGKTVLTSALLNFLLEASPAERLVIVEEGARELMLPAARDPPPWSQTLTFHPHVPCIVTGGGLSLDGQRWVTSRSDFLFPVAVLRRLFRGKLLAGLRPSSTGAS